MTSVRNYSSLVLGSGWNHGIVKVRNTESCPISCDEISLIAIRPLFICSLF